MVYKFDQDYSYHMLGIIRTNVPMYQGLYVGNSNVFQKKEKSALIYHIPLCQDGLRIRIGNIVEEGGKLFQKEKMVDFSFGDSILLDSRQFHSGYYRERGSLRIHGIFYTYLWNPNSLYPIYSEVQELFLVGKICLTHILTQWMTIVLTILKIFVTKSCLVIQRFVRHFQL